MKARSYGLLFCRTGGKQQQQSLWKTILGCPTNHYVILFQPCKTYIKEMRPANQQHDTVFNFGNFNTYHCLQVLQHRWKVPLSFCCIWIQDFERLYFDWILYPHFMGSANSLYVLRAKLVKLYTVQQLQVEVQYSRITREKKGNKYYTHT